MSIEKLKAFGAPAAAVYIDNELVGQAQQVQFREQITQTPVRGLGSLLVDEFVPTAVDCSFSSSYIFIGFDTPWFKKMLNRYGTVEQVVNTLSLTSCTFSLVVYRKDVTGVDSTEKLVTSVDNTGETVMNASDCVLESVSWSIAVGGIATSDVSGRYRTPMTIKA